MILIVDLILRKKKLSCHCIPNGKKNNFRMQLIKCKILKPVRVDSELLRRWTSEFLSIPQEDHG